MKNFSIASVYFFAVILTACSTSAEFIIANTTENNIKVTYTIQHKSCDINSFAPKLMKLNNLNWSDVEWHKLPIAEYKCDQVSNTISLVIPPQKAILILRDYNYFEHEKVFNEVYYKTLAVNISGQDGVISITGFQVMKAFKMLEPYQFVLSY